MDFKLIIVPQQNRFQLLSLIVGVVCGGLFGGLNATLFSTLLSSSRELHVPLVMYDVWECLWGACKTEHAF